MTDEHAILEGRALCRSCDAPLRTLPGESYGDDDTTLFDQIESTLHEAGISGLNAAQLAAEFDARSRSTPGRALRRMVLALPSLGLLEVLVAQEPACLRKVEGIMATLLEALATSRSHSGVISTHGAGVRFGPGSASGA